MVDVPYKFVVVLQEMIHQTQTVPTFANNAVNEKCIL